MPPPPACTLLTCTLLTCTPLPAALPAFAALTYPRFRPWLQAAPPVPRPAPSALWAITAPLADGTPAGLALVHLPPASPARLLSLMVVAERRRQGIGSALLRAAADCAHTAGAPALMAQHNSAATGTAAYDAFMTANGWPPAVLHAVRGFGRAGWARTAGETFARHRAALVRRGYALTPWATLSGADMAAMRALVASGAVPEGYDPFQMQDHDAPELSAVLRRHGAVVGWAKAHWQDAARTQAFYHSGWVLPEVARQGWLAVAMIDLSARQADLYGDSSLTGFATDAENLPMQGLLLNRFGALAERIDQLMQRTLRLADAASADADADADADAGAGGWSQPR